MSLKNVFKRDKEILVCSPLKGEVLRLEDMPDDAVNTSHVIGDGCAIIPEPGAIYAPLSSKKVEIFKTNHLLIFEPKKGVYVVIHFGIGTSVLEGKGFERIIELSPKKTVELGEKLVSYDLEFLKENAKSTITPILVSNDNIERVELIAKPGQKIEVGDPLLNIILK